MILKVDFKNHCLLEFEKWFEYFKHRNYDFCKKVSDNHIELCRDILLQKVWDAEEENNVAYITGVLFKGLIEFVQLAELTKDRKWHIDIKRTERVWGLMWNCIDRFKFSSKHFVAEGFSWIQKILEELKYDFVNYFGHGIYASPEILIKKEICSICNEDTRACNHLSGTLYNGRMCCSVPQEIQMKSVSLVTFPKDPRCRLWKWNMTEERTFTTPIMVLFRIDDWLIDEN